MVCNLNFRNDPDQSTILKLDALFTNPLKWTKPWSSLAPLVDLSNPLKWSFPILEYHFELRQHYVDQPVHLFLRKL